MTSCGLAGTVSNIQDCQSDSQLSTLELVCLILEKITWPALTLPLTPSRLLARCLLLRGMYFFRKRYILLPLACQKGSNICSQLCGIYASHAWFGAVYFFKCLWGGAFYPQKNFVFCLKACCRWLLENSLQ